MASQDLNKILRLDGRLVLNPTALGLAGAYPHGGTALGHVRAAEFRLGLRYQDVIAEEWGEVCEVHRVREVAVFAFVLTQRDPDALSAFLPKFTTAGGKTRIEGGKGPGIVAATNPILWAPIDLTHPGILIHRPLPLVEESAALQLATGEEAGIAFVLKAARATGNKVYHCDLLANLEIS